MSLAVQIQRAPWADPDVALPGYATNGAAGADVRANFPAEARAEGLVLPPMARALVPLGFSVAVPVGHEMQLRPRSGLAFKQGLTLLNTPGTIDSDYRGLVSVLVVNLGTAPIHLSHGERVAQAVIAPVLQADFRESADLSETARGAGGFGSTGVS